MKVCFTHLSWDHGTVLPMIMINNIHCYFKWRRGFWSNNISISIALIQHKSVRKSSNRFSCGQIAGICCKFISKFALNIERLNQDQDLDQQVLLVPHSVQVPSTPLVLDDYQLHTSRRWVLGVSYNQPIVE